MLIHTESMPIKRASWNSLVFMKFLPNVAVTLLITDVLSFKIKQEH